MYVCVCTCLNRFCYVRVRLFACVCVWKKCILFFIRTKVCNEKSKRCSATHRRIDFIRDWAGNFPLFLASLTVVRAWSISPPPPFPSTPSIDPSSSRQHCFEYLLCNFSLHATEIQKKNNITHTNSHTLTHTKCVLKRYPCCCPITVDLHSSCTRKCWVCVRLF